MALSQRLQLRQGQSLVMTPQLQQAIKLLQLSNLELASYVEGELERNPLLERDEVRDAEVAEPDRSGDEEAGEEAPALSLDNRRSDREALNELDSSRDNLFPDEARADAGDRSVKPPQTDSGWAGLEARKSGGQDSRDAFSIEATLSKDVSLRDHLSEQLNIAIEDPAGRMIGRHLIDMLDEAGYLAEDVALIAERLGTSEQMVHDTLKILQGLEPVGVFARNLAECLGLQLRERDRLDPAMQALLDNIELLAMHDFRALRKVCGVDAEDIEEMVAEILSLNPKPGLAFGSVVVHPVVPDVFVRAGADGSWNVELNSDTLPRVLVNNQYHAVVRKAATRDEDKTYISECFANASWLVKSLEQRARTILKVAREIVRQQDGFLAHGVQHLVPLKLKTVADAISMHESTVSRVTANKYIATPRGTYELKYFFTSAIGSSDGGEAHSAESVRHRIRELIDNEEPKAILSDDKIVELLRGEGIDIARRTVAKYREALNIRSSVQRRRQKNARL